MRHQKITSKQYFKTAKIIHSAIIGGAIVFLFVASFLMWGQQLETGYNDESNMFYIIVGIFGLLALFGGDFIFKNQLKKAKMHPALSQKMISYQKANIIKYAPIEGVSLFSTVAALLTLSVWFLVIAGVLILVLTSQHPTVDKAIKELDLNIDEQKQVRTPDAYISESMDNQ